MAVVPSLEDSPYKRSSAPAVPVATRRSRSPPDRAPCGDRKTRRSVPPGPRRHSHCACALGGRFRRRGSPPPSVSRDSMKTAEDASGARSEGPREVGLCLLCGLPAAGKSTFARALSHRLRQERGWAVGVITYDNVMPDAFLEQASARPLVSTGGGAESPVVDGRGVPLDVGLHLVWEGRPDRAGETRIREKWSRFSADAADSILE